MNTTPIQRPRPVHMQPKTDAEIEAEAIRELERMERALNTKRSNYKPKRRRWHHANNC